MTRMTAGTVHNTGRTAFRVGGTLVLPGKSTRVEDLETAELPARGVYVKPDADPDAGKVVTAPAETAAQARKRKAAEAEAEAGTAAATVEPPADTDPAAGTAGDDKPDTVEETQP